MGGNPLRHEHLWNFDGDIRPIRRYKKAPEAWGRKANYSERYCASKLEVSDTDSTPFNYFSRMELKERCEMKLANTRAEVSVFLASQFQ